MQETIVVQELGKRYYRFHAERPRTFQELFLRGPQRLRPTERFWALQDVSFSAPPGRMIGVIGRNGAGKSTLLRLIGGVGRPDTGTVQVCGRIGALLSLGTDFHPDLTGRENVFISGVIGGLTRSEVGQRFDSIVDFAQIESFIDSPLRTYSTGMKMRLAFAVMAHLESEILLIDEVLSVGDALFQRKCLAWINQVKAAGCTIIFVSHDLASIRHLCDEALWLRDGQLAAHGPAEMVVDRYEAEMEIETQQRTPAVHPPEITSTGAALRVNENRFGSLEMEIVDVQFLDATGGPITEHQSREPLRIEIEYLAPQPIDAPIFGVIICRDDGFVCCDTNTEATGLGLPTIQGSGRITLQIEHLDLASGSYYIDVGVYVQDWSYAYDYHWHVYQLSVHSPMVSKGLLHPPHQWQLEANKSRMAL